MLTEIRINKHNIIHNITAIRNIIPQNKKIIGVVKANAYGIGMREIVPILEEYVDVFAVDDIEELHAIRFLTEKPVYVLGYIPHELIEKAVDLNGTLVVYDTQTIMQINKAAQVYKNPCYVNLKIDALLGRQGVSLEELPEALEKLSGSKNVKIESIYAHFANVEDADYQDHAQKQIDYFSKACRIVYDSGYSNVETHISSTAGALVYDYNENTPYSQVRIGIGLYGLWPSESIKKKYEGVIELKPVCEWITHIAQVKDMKKGETVGYGLSHMLTRDSRVAVIPQGYSDGYSRLLSGKGKVLIQGHKCPVLGRIAMNMFVVDVTEVGNVQREDEVVLLGRQGNEEITAEELADAMETINYEVIARINPLLPRTVQS